MIRHVLTGTLLAAALVIGSASADDAQGFHAVFSGFDEVGELNAETGAILSPGKATLELQLDPQAQTLTYTLQYSGLSAPVTQAHIHFGKVHTPGGILVFLCTNLGNGPAGTQECPTSGTVTGTLTAASVQAIPGENVTAGDFTALVDALESDTAYANIHTTSFPSGEIRGQIYHSGF